MPYRIVRHQSVRGQCTAGSHWNPSLSLHNFIFILCLKSSNNKSVRGILRSLLLIDTVPPFPPSPLPQIYSVYSVPTVSFHSIVGTPPSSTAYVAVHPFHSIHCSTRTTNPSASKISIKTNTFRPETVSDSAVPFPFNLD